MCRDNVKKSRPMGKPTICIGENKGADQLRGNREADQRLCFRYSDSIIPLLLKSEISSFYSLLLWLCSLTCVRPVRKPHCWFSHEVAQKSECDSNDIRVAIKPVDAEIAMNGERPETNENNVKNDLSSLSIFLYILTSEEDFRWCSCIR